MSYIFCEGELNACKLIIGFALLHDLCTLRNDLNLSGVLWICKTVFRVENNLKRGLHSGK